MRKHMGWLGVIAILLGAATTAWGQSTAEALPSMTPQIPEASWGQLTVEAPDFTLPQIPFIARGQSTGEASTYEVPPVAFTGPLSHPRIEDGGFYTGVQFLYYNTNRPIGQQTVAIRGFLDNTGGITGTPNTFVGSRKDALDTEQLQGPGVFQPGYDIFIGWKFQGGISVELDWKHLVQANYAASASILPPSFQVGNQLQNTFLYSPVNNFPEQFAGAAQKVATGNPGDTYGIWNAASLMQINFVQRFDIYQINARFPIWQTENYRSYGLFGPRVAWLWDQFRWNTIDYDLAGNTSPQTSALYNNTVSNRMYGIHFGFGNDWYLGSTPIGAIAFTLDCEAGAYIDLVKTNAAYTRVDNVISESRNRTFANLVPSVETRLGFTWYPWEAVQVHLGYNIMAFFNTIASTQPIDFNMGTLDPQFGSYFLRYFQGLDFGVTFVF